MLKPTFSGNNFIASKIHVIYISPSFCGHYAAWWSSYAVERIAPITIIAEYTRT